MNAFIENMLKMLASEKAAFAFAVFSAINQAMDAMNKGLDSTIEFAYQYLPAKYKAKATEDEVKDAIKSYIDAFNKTEKLFK